MKRIDVLRTASKKIVSLMLCQLSDCSDCVAQGLCSLGHTGFIDWLEMDEDEYGWEPYEERNKEDE